MRKSNISLIPHWFARQSLRIPAAVAIRGEGASKESDEKAVTMHGIQSRSCRKRAAAGRNNKGRNKGKEELDKSQ